MKDIFAKKDKRSEIQKRYDEALLHLDEQVIGSKEYEDALSEVERLHAMVMAEKDHKKDISPETILGVAANALNVVLILRHEQFHNITSKALGFITKGRVR